MEEETERQRERQRYSDREKKARPEAETQVKRKEYNKDMQMWNFAIGSLSKLTVPLAVPEIKDHF